MTLELREAAAQHAALLAERLVSLSVVCKATGLSRSTIYRLVADGDFPKPVKPSKGRVAWREREVLAWLASVH
jgi:prophage regulatory protein